MFVAPSPTSPSMQQPLEAVMHGLQVTVIEDCLGYRDDECHEEAMRQMAGTFRSCRHLIIKSSWMILAGLLGDIVHEARFWKVLPAGLHPCSETESTIALTSSQVSSRLMTSPPARGVSAAKTRRIGASGRRIARSYSNDTHLHKPSSNPIQMTHLRRPKLTKLSV